MKLAVIGHWIGIGCSVLTVLGIAYGVASGFIGRNAVQASEVSSIKLEQQQLKVKLDLTRDTQLQVVETLKYVQKSLAELSQSATTTVLNQQKMMETLTLVNARLEMHLEESRGTK